MKTEIVYEDQDILICHKPAGLATQSASVSQPDVVSELKKYLGGGYLGIVHRLDQPVEGLLVFARNKKAAAELGRQLTQGILQKRYCALVYGQPPQESGRLVDYLRKEGSLSKVVPEGTSEAQKAVLQYRIRQAGGRTAAGGQSNGSVTHGGA
ncbi:MAG: RNA pseudouridine synthase, partial [Acetatifactor sp.]|nr:RNA pseudouridine synthase [Acetatifactor sp.]